MTLTDWLQTASLLGVALAVVFSAIQSRQATKQTRELGQQTAAVIASLEQSAYQILINSHSDFRATYLRNDPDMLRWHLSARGFPTSTDEENQHALYVLHKLDTHESSFLSHAAGVLSDDIWTGWNRVAVVDFGTPEFRVIWKTAKQFYAPTFVRYVDEVLLGGRLPSADTDVSG